MKPQGSSGDAYWRDTLKLLTIIMVIWALASFGAGIIFADALNSIKIGGFKLGFWFAQQGSIYVFLLLIYWYSRRMGQIDRKHDVHED